MSDIRSKVEALLKQRDDSFYGGSFHKSYVEQLESLVRASVALVEAVKSIQQEIHNEHCDEDWHCNWCEQSMIALAAFQAEVEKAGNK